MLRRKANYKGCCDILEDAGTKTPWPKLNKAVGPRKLFLHTVCYIFKMSKLHGDCCLFQPVPLFPAEAFTDKVLQ